MTEILIALGSNLGNKKINLANAISRLENFLEKPIESSTYISSPVDYFNQPDFYNMVALLKQTKT